MSETLKRRNSMPGINDIEFMLAQAEMAHIRAEQRWKERQREEKRQRELDRREQLRREIAAMRWGA